MQVVSGLKAVLESVRRRYSQPGRVARRLADRLDWTVQGGPFQGLRYPRRPCDGRIVPRLVGSYELEIQPWIERLLTEPRSLVATVGCGDGYYAVGFARAMPSTKVVAFERSEAARTDCLDLADENAVTDRVTIRGTCDAAALRELELEEALLLCDCGGRERTLLDPDEVPQLTACVVLAEFHDDADPGVSDAVLERFAPTHRIATAQSAPRDPARFEALRLLPRADRSVALDEERTLDGVLAHRLWALMTPK